MSNYTANIKFKIEFDGDPIAGVMKTASIQDMKSLAPYIKTSGGADEVTMSFSDSLEIVTVASEIFPRLITSFTGLHDSSGNPVDVKTVCSELYFLPVVMELFSILSSGSSVKSADEKKLDGTSQEVPLGQAK